MRLLALKPGGIALPAIHDSMVRAFRSLGIEVYDFPVPKLPNEFTSFRARIPKGVQAVFALDAGVSREFILILKDLQRSIRIPWIIWFLDDPEGYDFPAACNPDYTLGFCWDREIAAQTNASREWKGMALRHLPLGTDASVFYPAEGGQGVSMPGGTFVGSTAHANALFDEVAGTTPGFQDDVEKVWEDYLLEMGRSLPDLARDHLAKKTGRERLSFRSDPLALLWVRALIYHAGIKKRIWFVSELIRGGGAVFGDERWQGILAPNLYRGPAVYGDPLRKIYNESAFALDIRQPQSRTGLTQRIFDASACGVPVMSEWSSEMMELFDSGDEVFGFSSLDQAREVKDRILRDPRDARKKANRARMRILSLHTYLHRARQIVDVLRRF